MNIQLIKDYAKRQLRNEFDEANGWEAIGIIDRAKEMGFDELAADMDSDLKADSDFHKQVNSDHNDSISEGARL